MTPAQIKKLITQAQSTIKHSKKAVKDSNTLLATLDKKYEKEKKEYAQKDATINSELTQVAQLMDEETIKFIKNTA